MTGVDLIKEVEKRRTSRLEGQRKTFRQTTCRASNIGECDRQLYYEIVNWADKPPVDLETQARFDEGIEQHKKVRRELLEDGFEVIEGEKSFELKGRNGRVICTGHIDGKISMNETTIPFEIKSLNPNIFAQINTLDDFNKYQWARKYPRQIQLYLFGENKEIGIYILTDCLGHRKYFTVKLNYEQTEQLITRCELVVESVERKVPPPFHKDVSVCRRCWALGRLCTPPLDFGPGIQVIDDPEIEEALKRREELAESAKEHKALDKQIKEYFKERPDCLVGDFHVSGRWVETKAYTKEVPAGKYWKVKIDKIKG